MKKKIEYFLNKIFKKNTEECCKQIIKHLKKKKNSIKNTPIILNYNKLINIYKNAINDKKKS